MALEETHVEYSPPFDMLSDMLFVFALAPGRPLGATFPGVPFLTLRGRVPLVMWFSRVKEGVYSDPTTGERRRLGGPDRVLYNELNVLAALKRRAGFVPGIYATSALTIEVGRRYGMPKQPTRMDLLVKGKRFCARVVDHGERSYVVAGLLGNGRMLGWSFSRVWPRWTWPAHFPDGRYVRVLIRSTPAVQVAHVRAGRLALNAPWLPDPVSLFPFGFYIPNLRMRLPPPPLMDK